ncbi:ankyrin repeat-containing domain protein [Bisporella sp. PMI_857]|nr:ankyrin repeat-containing domain protein [Bisporella sp. PMI_857]
MLLLIFGGYGLSGSALCDLIEHGGRITFIRWLLDWNIVDYTEINASGETALNVAARRGAEETIRLLLERPQIEVNHEDMNPAPLVAAVVHGHLPIVKLLLERREIEINHKDVDDITPLAAAVIHACLPIVELLLNQEEVDVKEGGPLRTTPLLAAKILGHSPIRNALELDKRLKINMPGEGPRGERLVYIRRAYLATMARGNSDTGLRRLIYPGVRFMAGDSNGRSLVHRAPIAGAVSAMRILIKDYRMHVDIKGSKGRTPFSYAIERA